MIDFRPVAHDDGLIEVWEDQKFLGELVRTGWPKEAEPEGRMFHGPWVLEPQGEYIGWAALREITHKIEHLNTRWNWVMQGNA